MSFFVCVALWKGDLYVSLREKMAVQPQVSGIESECALSISVDVQP